MRHLKAPIIYPFFIFHLGVLWINPGQFMVQKMNYIYPEKTDNLTLCLHPPVKMLRLGLLLKVLLC